MRRQLVRRDAPRDTNTGSSNGSGAGNKASIEDETGGSNEANKGHEGTNEGTEIPGEGGTKTPEQLENEQIHATARDKGWRPKEEFTGEKASWIDANEFLKREPLFDRIKNQSKEIKGLRKTVEAMVNQHSTQVAAQVKQKLKELKDDRTAAIQLGDVAKVEEIDGEIAETHQQVNDAKPAANEDVANWVADNPWFETNKEMNDFAVAYNKAQFSKNGGDAMASLVATRKAVERAFPEEFDKQPGKQPSGGPDNGGEPKGNGGKGFNMGRLSTEQKLVYNQHVKVHKIVSHEEFFKGLEDIGELS